MLPTTVIETELKTMQARRDELRNSFWQADGACQVLEQLLNLARQAESAGKAREADAPDESMIPFEGAPPENP